MDKVRKKFVWYAEFAVFILLTVLLSVINVINFEMVAEDADRLTEMISHSSGTFSKEYEQTNTENKVFKKKFGEMGPDSPEIKASLRFFTYAFPKKNNQDATPELIEYKMSAISQDEAYQLASSLLKGNPTGWTNLTYRYRVYKNNDMIYVTVIDQDRELLPCYRILIISAIGEVLVLLISYLVLVRVGKKLFKQFDEADRKQKAFIANIEQDFKMPLTVISANTEVLERKNGSDEQTKAIDRQVRKMTKLVKELGTLTIFEEKDMTFAKTDLSALMNKFIQNQQPAFETKNIRLDHEIEPDITIDGDEQALQKALSELAENALKYSLTKANFTLKKQKDRIIILQTNDTDLPDGNIDQIFDKFTTLENAKDKNSTGLGLSFVKDIAKAHNGRVSAKVANGIFDLEIAL